jgi:uncharacterized membrane protein
MTDSATVRRSAPRPSFLSLVLTTLGSGAAAALVFALALQAPEPLLAGRLPALRLKQVSDHWWMASIAVDVFGFLVALVALWRRRSRFPELATNAGDSWRLHAWLLLMLLPALATYVRPAWAGMIATTWSPWCVAFAISGWLAGLWTFAAPEAQPMALRRAWLLVLLPTLLFAALFAGLAIQQYRALHVPHGDAGMYEEHLWNFLHGKGFRSQLDDGRLFLGEHIEVIHILLVPLYYLRPILPTLNLCQAFGLALGAVAVFGIARSLHLPVRAAVLMSWAYLCWFPMQALALEQTWKTFRPETLGVPLLLFGFWMMESERPTWASLFFVLSWTAKEEFALVTAFVGLSLCLTGRWRWGALLGIVSLAYLVVALQVLIPMFRAGAPPHYTPYFKSLGETPREIVVYILTHPLEVLRRMTSGESLAFVMMMLASWMFLPLMTARRLLPALPIFGYLMLGDRPELRDPRFHFHAPLVGVLPWSAAWGLAHLSRRSRSALPTSRLVFLLSLTTCIWFGRGPISYAFYEPLHGIPRVPNIGDPSGLPLFKPEGSYWRDVYIPTTRSEAFRRVLPIVRPNDRVAATDYIRTRFTHCRAAHDYPTFRAHVKIDDVDVIVLDKTEGYWGRDPKTNHDHELLDAMNSNAPVGSALKIRGRPFTVVHHDAYFLVVRRAAAR